MHRPHTNLISQFAHAPANIAATIHSHISPEPLRDLSTVPDPLAVRMREQQARAKAQLAAAKAARIAWEQAQRENAPQANVVPRTRVW